MDIFGESNSISDRKEYNTKTKKKIISFLFSQKCKTLSEKEIYYYLKANDINIDLSTVYRSCMTLYTS